MSKKEIYESVANSGIGWIDLIFDKTVDFLIFLGNITSKTIEPLITKRTKAICIVHIAGWPADMSKIIELAKKHNLNFIEDINSQGGLLEIGVEKTVL